MAKAAIWDYSTTAASNTDVDGVDSTGTTGLVKSGDNYTRSIMAHAKGFALDLGSVNTVGGTADAITVTLAAAPSALVDGMRITINASAANTGATTLNVTPAGGSAFGAKKVMKWSAGSEAELSAGDIPAANALIELIYDSARNTAAGAWMLLGSSVAAATTTSSGTVELATDAEALTGTDTSRAVTPSGLYFPTGHLYGLTLANGTDATNDINIAAGTARDASDTYNYVLASTYVKQIDAAWALGSAAGGLDTGSVGNSRYAIWGIGRSDTKVCDVLFSTSFSAPTMPTDYDFKVLIGEFTRTGGVNGTPLWYGPRRASTGYAGITLGSPTASTSGTSIDFTGIPAWAKRVTVNLSAVSTSGTNHLLIQVGDAGGVETSGYDGNAVGLGAGLAVALVNSTAGFIL